MDLLQSVVAYEADILNVLVYYLVTHPMRLQVLYFSKISLRDRFGDKFVSFLL